MKCWKIVRGKQLLWNISLSADSLTTTAPAPIFTPLLLRGKQREIDESESALLYALDTDPDAQVLRFEDGSMLMLAPRKEEEPRLAPSASPAALPRRIPPLVRFQLLTFHGGALLFVGWMLMTVCMVANECSWLPPDMLFSGARGRIITGAIESTARADNSSITVRYRYQESSGAFHRGSMIVLDSLPLAQSLHAGDQVQVEYSLPFPSYSRLPLVHNSITWRAIRSEFLIWMILAGFFFAMFALTVGVGWHLLHTAKRAHLGKVRVLSVTRQGRRYMYQLSISDASGQSYAVTQTTRSGISWPKEEETLVFFNPQAPKKPQKLTSFTTGNACFFTLAPDGEIRPNKIGMGMTVFFLGAGLFMFIVIFTQLFH